MKRICLAGGCFWGTEKYLYLIPGVTATEAGYANGSTEAPTYEDVCYGDTGHAEAVLVEFDEQKLGLKFLLSLFFESIDPTSLDRQGGDVGRQYRTGIYYIEQSDREIIDEAINELQLSLEKPVAVEVVQLENFFPAEQYHQKYLDKNPGGYCHIGLRKFERARTAVDPGTRFKAKSKELLRKTLTPLQYEVTQNSATEPPFANEYFDNFEPGIYVDITTGQPLFASSEKFESGCGWPSFSRPISQSLIQAVEDDSLGIIRTEVRSRHGDSHLGHVFADGPEEFGGLRFCINSASLRFIPRSKMDDEGYGYLSHLAL